MHSLQMAYNSNPFSAFQNLVQICSTNDLDSEQKNKLITDFIDKNKNEYPFRKDNEVIFVYFGIGKLIHVVGDFNGWDSFDDSSKMIQVNKTKLFYLKKTFPNDSRLDYQIIVDTDWILDPLNPSKILGGFGLNSEISMPKHIPKLDINHEQIKIPQGTITELEFHSQIQKNWMRKIFIYLPANYNSSREKKYPSLFAVDGTDYLKAGNAKETLDLLIFQQKIPEIIGIFIDPLTPNLRIRDFNGKNCHEENDEIDYNGKTDICKQKYCEFLVRELIPFIDNKYNTIKNDPTKRAHIGVSIGGILSSYIGSKFPEIFKLIGSQSGSFWIDTSVYESFVNPKLNSGIKIYLKAGIFEKRNYNHTKEFAFILKQNNYNFKDEYFNLGHSWGVWKETFSPMLEYLFN